MLIWRSSLVFSGMFRLVKLVWFDHSCACHIQLVWDLVIRKLSYVLVSLLVIGKGFTDIALLKIF